MTTTNSEHVSVIGLGSMGAALAGAFIAKGYHVTVWNRDSSKMQPLIKKGAFAAADIQAAIKASNVIVICVSDYKATRNILAAEGIATSLKGRTLLQLSTGTPKEARDMDVWAQELGAYCLNGDI